MSPRWACRSNRCPVTKYLLTEHDAIGGVKHFALWPLAQAARSCFDADLWPDYLPVPQAWIEFEVRDINTATDALKARGYRLLVDNRIEPWGQTVTRLLSPEGLLTGITVTPWLREGKVAPTAAPVVQHHANRRGRQRFFRSHF
jgi:hypothetical protein